MSEKSKEHNKRRKKLAEIQLESESKVTEVSVSKALQALKDFEVDVSKRKVKASTEVSEPIDPLEISLSEESIADYDDDLDDII